MSEEIEVEMMKMYLTFAIVLWIPLGYIMILKYISWNIAVYIFTGFGLIGLVYFILACVQVLKIKKEA